MAGCISDLFADNAVYHNTCKNRFEQKLPHSPGKKKRGRPHNLEALQAFTRLCDRLECECENELYTLIEVYDIMVGLAEENGEDCST